MKILLTIRLGCLTYKKSQLLNKLQNHGAADNLVSKLLFMLQEYLRVTDPILDEDIKKKLYRIHSALRKR